MPSVTGRPVGRPKVEVTKSTMIRSYEKHGNWEKVARELGVSRATLVRRVREFGIECKRVYG